MVGSTALSGVVDPELLGSLIRRYQDATAGAIGRFGGFVAKFMGDGVLAYFGFPRAFEDAAERAVRAAIGILAEVGGIERPDGARLQARIGIATGLVVVGEIVGTGTAQERTIVGETPNLAARLQALAAPDTILISETTHNLLGGLFELEPTGEHELKGFARPVPAWRVLGEAAVVTPLCSKPHRRQHAADRARPRNGADARPLASGALRRGPNRHADRRGRDRQVALDRSFARSDRRRAAWPHSFAMLALSCDSALYPVIQQISRTAGFATADSPGIRFEKLGALFSHRAASDASAIPLLAELLSIPDAPPRRNFADAGATESGARLRSWSTRSFAWAKPSRCFSIVEDAHWIDATTLEMLTRISDSIAQARLLVVVTARPDFAPPWLARPHATLLTLGRLSRAECAELIAGVAASHGLSADTVATIVAKTDGVPLFAEELTKSVLESAGEDSAAVPATLKDSLMARLDRLGEAREVAQIAAVIGRQFAFSLLDAVVPRHGADLEAALAKLVAAGIVFPEGRGQERSFSFKHALMRDAAYESLLLARRREWHERIARALEEHFPELTANEPELLAHHFGEAGLAGLACDYRMRAGDRAVSRSAYQEADRRISRRVSNSPRPCRNRLNGMRRAIGFSAEARPGADGRGRSCKARRPRKPIAAPARSAQR